MPEFVGRTLPQDMQRLNEDTHNMDRVDNKIREKVLSNPDVQVRVQQGVELVKEWLSQEYYESKQARLNQLKEMDIEKIVEEIYVGSVYSQSPDLFTNVTGMIASRLKFSAKKESIETVAELMAVLWRTGVYELTKENEQASIYVQSNFRLDNDIIREAEIAQYLPPLVMEPKEIKHNKDSAYLTKKGSFVLGSGNHHEGDLCLDVWNKMTQIPLCLNVKFLSTYEEVPKKALDDPEKVKNWTNFKRWSYYFYSLIVRQGNKFYLEHRPDKRGRGYSQGYHISTQGTSFKKASVDLYEQEVVEGVPQFIVNAGKYEGHGEKNYKFCSEPMSYTEAQQVAKEYASYPWVTIEPLLGE